MWSGPSSPAVSGVESVLVAGSVLAFGYLLVSLAPRSASLDPALRLGLAFPALGGFTAALMLFHMASGGLVLSHPWVVRGSVLAVTAWSVTLGIRRRGETGGPGAGWRDTRVALLVVLAGWLVWSTPVGRLLPVDPTRGDIPWHMGLANQLLNGETTPAAAITGVIPNYYPWLYHALVALVACLTPGGRAYEALGPVQLVVVAGGLLSLYALGREMTGRWITGLSTALLAGLTGGFGFTLLRGLDVVLTPRGPGSLRYHGDLMYKRSYNVSFSNMTPPYPRDVSLLLLVGVLLILVVALKRRSTPMLMAAGAVAGLSGLAGGEAFFVALGVCLAVVPFARGMGRVRASLALLLPLGAVWSIWIVPLAVSYLRYGGFTNITQVGPVNLPPGAILVTWGIVTPLGAYGFLRSIRRARESPGVTVALATLAVSASALALSVLLRHGSGEALLSLSRRHRYWPLLDLAIALFAALGLTDLLGRARRRSMALAVALAVAVAAVALPSPVVASVALPSKIAQNPILTAGIAGDPDSLLTRLLQAPGRRCVAAVPPGLGYEVFGATGYRLVLFRWHGYKRNLARIRWRGIYQHIPGDLARIDANERITGGEDPVSWRRLVDEFGVDVVVSPAAAASAPAFRGHPVEPAHAGKATYVVVWVGPC